MLLQDWRYKAGIEEGRSIGGADLRYAEAQRDIALIAFYKSDPVACAALCDDHLDKTGMLLGLIRREAANSHPGSDA